MTRNLAGHLEEVLFKLGNCDMEYGDRVIFIHE
jgi:hypothetical protein